MLKLAAAGALALIALPAHAQTNAQPYRALGTEPFWSLTIDGRSIRYQPAGGRETRVAKPRPIVGFNGERYVTRGLTVDITHVECSDGMSDRTFHDTVRVTVGRRTLKGCGGEVLSDRPDQGARLDGNWRIEAIDGRAVAPRTTPSVTFDGRRISGNASCNRFSGTFRYERGALTAGPLASTKMACMERVKNVQESTILGLLGARLTVTRDRAGKLVLRNPAGRTLTLAPERR